MKAAAVFVLFLVLLPSCSQEPDGMVESVVMDERLTKKFRSGGKEIGDDLYFLDAKNFRQEFYMHSDYYQVGEPESWFTTTLGEYEVINNRVILYPKEIERSIEFHFTIVIQDCYPYFDSDTTRIKTEYSIVEWSDNVYLLSEDSIIQYGEPVLNDFKQFARCFNRGDEPRWPRIYFSNRQNKTVTEALDLSQVPAQYHSLFAISNSNTGYSIKNQK